MKIKWHWGTKLLVAMILFMMLLLTFVVLSTKQSYDLVERDYYPKALEYQDRIDKTNNARALKEKIIIDNQDNSMLITFQSIFDPSAIRGEITFYRPSNTRMDRTFSIQPDEGGEQRCDLDALLTGKYIVKFDYVVNGTGYYQEETVYIRK